MICKGEYRYMRTGKPTGHRELWQITHLPNGAEIVRAEVAGDGDNGSVSLLTHLQRRASGELEWLRLRRDLGEGLAAAQYTFDEDTVKVIRQAESQPRRQETVEVAKGYAVDYHPVIAHDYAWRVYPAHARGKTWSVPVFSPDLWAEPAEALSGRSLRFNIKPLGAEDVSTPLGDFEQVRAFEIGLNDGVMALVWYDEFGVPLRWQFPDKAYDFVLVAYERTG